MWSIYTLNLIILDHKIINLAITPVAKPVLCVHEKGYDHSTQFNLKFFWIVSLRSLVNLLPQSVTCKSTFGSPTLSINRTDRTLAFMIVKYKSVQQSWPLPVSQSLSLFNWLSSVIHLEYDILVKTWGSLLVLFLFSYIRYKEWPLRAGQAEVNL